MDDESVGGTAGAGEWVEIGRLLRTRGNRGELIGELDSQKVGREKLLDEVALERGGRRQIFRVESVWRNQTIYGGNPVFKFAGIDSISDAEVWEGAVLLVRPESAVALEPGEYSFADLVGCRLEQLKDGSEVGVIERIEEYGGPALLCVRRPNGVEAMIPFARSICREIDIPAKRIRVDLPEGMLDL